MKPSVFTALLLAVPLVASAQAIRCTDPATGKVLYTDQPCKNGEVVVPKRSEEEIRQEALAAQEARERRAEQQEQALRREAQSREAARLEAAARPPLSPAETAECRTARAEADFRARSNTATVEQIRTARYNAALACGQQPPADVVVVQPDPWGVVPPRPHVNRPPGYGWGQGGGVQPPANPPQRPSPGYSGGTLDNRAIPVAPAKSAPTQPRPSSVGISTSRGSGTARPEDNLPAAPSGAAR